MQDYTLCDLMNLLDCDPQFSYKLTTVNGKYEITQSWFEEGWGEYSKVIISVDKYKDLKELLYREVQRLFK